MSHFVFHYYAINMSLFLPTNTPLNVQAPLELSALLQGS